MDVNKRLPNAWTEVWDFQLAGSSFKASDGSYRQTSLRRAFKKQEDLDPVLVELERYEYDGAPAYRVYFDDREVGNVPKDVAVELARMEDSGYTVFGDDCEVYGGPDDDFPDKKFGARVYVRLRRKITEYERQDELSKLAHKAAQSSFTYSDSGFPRASDAGGGKSKPQEPRKPLASREPREPQEPQAPQEPQWSQEPQGSQEPQDPPAKRPRKKSKWKTVLIVIGIIWLVAVIPQIINAVIGARDFKNSPPEMQASAQAVSERLASEDSTVSSAPVQEPEPAPVEETFIPPDPITYTGSGDDYFDISPFDSLYYFHISGNSEDRHFSVTGYDAAGNYTELFVNTTDYYNGYVLDPEQDTRTLEVDAECPWTIEVVSLYTAPVLPVGETYSGIDDAVLLLPSDCRSAIINGNTLSRYFSVITYGSGYNLLVNTVDPYSGTVRIDPGATVMTIHAVGGWSISLQ